MDCEWSIGLMYDVKWMVYNLMDTALWSFCISNPISHVISTGADEWREPHRPAQPGAVLAGYSGGERMQILRLLQDRPLSRRSRIEEKGAIEGVPCNEKVVIFGAYHCLVLAQ